MVEGVDFFAQGGERGERFCAFLEKHDGLHDVGIVVAVDFAADFAEARLMSFPDFGDIAEQYGDAVVLGDDDVLRMSSMEWSRPMPRTLTLWLPRVR